MAMDQGHIYTTLIQDKSGVKSIIGADIFSMTKQNLIKKRNQLDFQLLLVKPMTS